MPYINQTRRLAIEFLKQGPKEIGEYNFLITDLCNFYLKKNGLCYKSINELVGVLECTKLELYRKLSWYEDQKEKENGSVLNKEFIGGDS